MSIEFIDQLAFNSTVPIISAFFIGMASAIAPCAFATNIAAICYISRNLDDPRRSLASGMMFTFGRVLTYVVIGAIMISAGRIIGGVARDVQTYGNLAMGPLLIAMGFIFLDVISINVYAGNGILSRAMKLLENKGEIGAFLMGMLFALAFCPYSGLLFFGLLIPLSLGTSYGVGLPAVFGVGISIPVLLFVALLFISSSKARSYGRAINATWPFISKGLGLVLVITGCYYLSPYIAERFGMSYVFESLVMLSLSIAGLLAIRSIKSQEGEGSGDEALSPRTSGRSGGPDGRTSSPHTDGIPRAPHTSDMVRAQDRH